MRCSTLRPGVGEHQTRHPAHVSHHVVVPLQQDDLQEGQHLVVSSEQGAGTTQYFEAVGAMSQIGALKGFRLAEHSYFTLVNWRLPSHPLLTFLTDSLLWRPHL